MPITNQVSEFQSSQSQAHLDSTLWLLFLDDLDLNGKCGHSLPVTLFWRDLNVLGTILWIDLYVSISAPQLTEKCNYLLYLVNRCILSIKFCNRELWSLLCQSERKFQFCMTCGTRLCRSFFTFFHSANSLHKPV